MAAQPALIIVEVEVGVLTGTKAKDLVEAARKDITPQLPDGIPSIFVQSRDGIPTIKVSTLFM